MMFRRMASGDISLFKGVRVRIETPEDADLETCLIRGVRAAFSEGDMVSAMTGRGVRRKRISVDQLLDQWKRRQGLVNITDLHIRDTAFAASAKRRDGDYPLLARASVEGRSRRHLISGSRVPALGNHEPPAQLSQHDHP
jgi:hypothetical protein